jgi:hypothetical protein
VGVTLLVYLLIDGFVTWLCERSVLLAICRLAMHTMLLLLLPYLFPAGLKAGCERWSVAQLAGLLICSMVVW